MHIPQSDTSFLNILSYREALEKSSSENYDRERWLYVPDFYTEYRYVLGTKGDFPVICIGINPSTAEPDNLDPTLKSVARIAESTGLDSWLMFDVYAQRATRPDDMDRNRNERLHAENMEEMNAYMLKTWMRFRLFCTMLPPMEELRLFGQHGEQSLKSAPG